MRKGLDAPGATGIWIDGIEGPLRLAGVVTGWLLLPKNFYPRSDPA
jgi:hypothetical protein